MRTKAFIVVVVLAVALVCVLPEARARQVPIKPISTMQVGRVIVCWPLGLMGDEEALGLALIADQVFTRVESVLEVDPVSIGSVRVMCEEITDVSLLGAVGGNRAGIIMYVPSEAWHGIGRWAGSKHLLALEYSRTVFARTSASDYSQNIAFFDGIATAVADLAYPGHADFPFRYPHLICAGLLMLDYLQLPAMVRPSFYEFLTGESFCRFLAEKHGGRILVELDRALRLTSDANSAFMDVFGRSLDELEEDWRSMLRCIISEERDRERALMLGRAVRDLSTLVWPSRLHMSSLAEIIGLGSPSLVSQSAQRFYYDVCDALYDLDVTSLPGFQPEYESALNGYVHSLQVWRDCAELLLLEVTWPVDSGAGRQDAVLESIGRVRQMALGIGAEDIIDLCEQYQEKAASLKP